MKLKEAVRKYEWVLIPLILVVVGSFFGGSYYGERKTLSSLDSKCDTTVKVVTVYKDFPKPAETALAGFVSVPAYKFITDTVTFVKWAEIAIPVHDTTVVYLPREQKYYEEEEGRVKVWVSGYEPRLDRYEVSWPETTITQTLVHRQRWSFSVSGGWGFTYDVFKKGLATGPSIVIGGSYSF